jgi:hypothetical protein
LGPSVPCAATGCQMSPGRGTSLGGEAAFFETPKAVHRRGNTSGSVDGADGGLIVTRNSGTGEVVGKPTAVEGADMCVDARCSPSHIHTTHTLNTSQTRACPHTHSRTHAHARKHVLTNARSVSQAYTYTFRFLALPHTRAHTHVRLCVHSTRAFDMQLRHALHVRRRVLQR